MALADEVWTPCSEDAVWLAYLRSEWNRVVRLNPQADERIVSAANLDSAGENDERCRLLATIRWPLIEGIPDDTRWFQVHTLRPEHFAELHVIGRCGWDHQGADGNELTAVSARRQLPLHADIAACEPILWGHTPEGPFTILEANEAADRLGEGGRRACRFTQDLPRALCEPVRMAYRPSCGRVGRG